MGLILDTSILVAGERRRLSLKEILEPIKIAVGDVEGALSVVTLVELTHGVFRAPPGAFRAQRQAFCDELCRNMIVHPVTLEIARLAGKIEGEQGAVGIKIAFEDLLIGATALHFGFDVATHNVRHFKLIPGLHLVVL
jgi:tRNA(fMet)-specific endonuclease VapC